MIIHINLESKYPIYTQVRNQIIEGIALGELKSGERLPSVRGMASDLGINLHTVNKGYKQLEKEGFLQIHRQRGVIVAPEEHRKADDFYREDSGHQVKMVVAEAICRGVSEEEVTRLIKETYQTFEKGGDTDGNSSH
ncbi:GntR family transcriptional regulator [Salimicrobium flavidum]|uniref:Transcriptional regulator, GntR family n=1 Tax=Salimicrobium flavidum TaxID=570947 RepID=A0A1N7ITD8_9BACI|nr:GntR family transcriptional regulator [Salimicrobium flavidum]SIS40368.1 transcriptional regulator, GntR family [Salimicrobium flavidum]